MAVEPERWISALWAARLVAAAAAEGVDVASQLATLSLSPADLRSDEAVLSERQHLALWTAVMTSGADASFPIRYAQAMTPDHYGVLGLAMKTAANVGDVLTILSRYLCVWTNAVRCRVHDDPGPTARIELERDGHRSLGMRAANESAVAELVHGLRQITQRPVVLREACFRHSAPETSSAQSAFFGCPVRYMAAFDGIVIERSLLTQSVRLGDRGLSRFMGEQLDELAKKTPKLESFSGRVGDAIADALPGGRPKVAAIARQLGVSARTLQRRLADEGASFDHIVEHTRRSISTRLLTAGTYPIAEVAFLVGYSEPSAFHRAFRRWFDETPGHFRQRTRGAAADA